MQKNLMQLGRSMVEMLGVLAIIGVLSVVGLMGYKKAMSKFHANELMNLAMQVYNGAIARSMVISSTDSALHRTYLRDVDYSCGNDATQNIGGERPSWTHERFQIVASLFPTNQAAKKHHELYFYFTSAEDCEALKSMTTWQSNHTYRLLPGSVNDSLPYGIWVYCYSNSSGSGSLWLTTDTY